MESENVALAASSAQHFEGELFDLDQLPTASEEDKDKGPDVPLGINFMGETDGIEVGEVRPCEPAGFIQAYLENAVNGLDRLAGVIGQFVVRQNDGFWVRSRSGTWTATTQGAAIGRVKTEWRDELYGQGVRYKSKHIEDVFRRSLLPVVIGTLIRVDGADRRMMMVESTNDLEQARAMIARIKPILEDRNRFRSAVVEFGAWLDTIKIDNDLVRGAISTELKDDLIEATRDPVETFVLFQIEKNAWARDQKLTNDEFWDRYRAWCENTNVFPGYRTQTHLRNGLVRLRARRWVETARSKSARGWTLINPPDEPATVEASREVIDFFRGDSTKKTSLLEQMRERRAAEGRMYR